MTIVKRDDITVKCDPEDLEIIDVVTGGEKLEYFLTLGHTVLCQDLVSGRMVEISLDMDGATPCATFADENAG